MRRFQRMDRLSSGELCRSLLLPLLLLIAQQGALLHELSHYAPSETQDDSDKQRPTTGKSCELCLAFTQVESTATNDVAVPTLLASLSFASAARPLSAVVAAELPAQRNRGPPATL